MSYRKTILLACLLLFISFVAFSQNFDIDMLRPINHHESAFKNSLFKFTSNSVTVVNLAAPASIFAAGLIKHDTQLKRDAAYMFGGFIASSAFTQMMKRITKRDRPFITYPEIIKKSAGGGYSFPSGHTTAAFSTATSLSLIFPKWYVIAPSYLYASAVGYGRMYQGDHYPTDVFAGAIVGAGGAWLAYKAEKWMNKKNRKENTTPVAL
jgi:membrane-associated phospholipid phosphatase